MHVTIIGTGYVGLTTAVALAYVGHEITAVDKVAEKIILLREGKSPIHEAGVAELLAHVSRRLHFTEDLTQGVPQAEVIFIAVGTPTREDGTSDLRYVEDAAREVAAALHPGQTCTLVLKSTVPIGTNRRIIRLVDDMLAERHVAARVTMASNPEFLREGVALHDTLYCRPHRRGIGSTGGCCRAGSPLPAYPRTDLRAAEFLAPSRTAALSVFHHHGFRQCGNDEICRQRLSAA